eukprot:3202181-Amphidinium_carterae.1
MINTSLYHVPNIRHSLPAQRHAISDVFLAHESTRNTQGTLLGHPSLLTAAKPGVMGAKVATAHRGRPIHCRARAQ